MANQGRTYDQITKDGASSAGSLGPGGTGDAGQAGAGNRQSGTTRTDDLLSDGSDDDTTGGYVGEEAGELQTGLGGLGSLSTGNAGSRQSATDDMDQQEPSSSTRKPAR